MSAGNGGQEGSKRAVPDGFGSWNAYWTAKGMPWRTEPEIDEERQRHLAKRRQFLPSLQQALYPFKDISLNRSDIEWLLATHESGGLRGPVNWDDDRQRARRGIDLRGVDLRQADLRNLPLARVRAGLGWDDTPFSRDDFEPAAAHLEGADLGSAHLEGADFIGVHLENARLDKAFLQKANLMAAHLPAAVLEQVNLEEAELDEADLRGTNLWGAVLAGARLSWARLSGADLRGAHLERANLYSAHLDWARAEEEEVRQVHAFQPTTVRFPSSQGHFDTVLPSANLQEVHFDQDTRLHSAALGDGTHGSVKLADARYNGVNLAVVDWSEIGVLGDEREARSLETAFRRGKPAPHLGSTSNPDATGAFEAAMRAAQQLATALRDQGMSEEADRFAYRARVLQRHVLYRRAVRRQYPPVSHRQRVRLAGRFLFSGALDGLAGYGYRPLRTLFWYLAVIGGFAYAYFLATHGALTFGLSPSQIRPLPWYEALVLSVSSFHGRGFFQPVQSLGDPVAILAAIEAVFGLFIEVSFIATFTQRYFGK